MAAGETRLSEHITIRDGLAVEIRPFYWDTNAVDDAMKRANA
jgi:hypothetical protein